MHGGDDQFRCDDRQDQVVADGNGLDHMRVANAAREKTELGHEMSQTDVAIVTGAAADVATVQTKAAAAAISPAPQLRSFAASPRQS